MVPKGYKYWEQDGDGNFVISSDAPQWAKDEFEKYQEQLEEAEVPDTEGNTHYL